MIASQTYVTTPSYEEIEDAWFNLMQGELGIARDRKVQEVVQSMVDYMRRSLIFDNDGQPLNAISSTETARRVAAAYAALIY